MPLRVEERDALLSIRIALLTMAAWLAVVSGYARAALQSKDPDQAPIAAVDRFSDKAATIQMRTADSHLPGPNEQVDFDTGPFITQGLSPSTGKPVRYYNFDIQGTTPAPVYVLYREGEDKTVADQLDIIDTLPGDKGLQRLPTGLESMGAKGLCCQHDHRRRGAVTSRLQVGKNRYVA